MNIENIPKKEAQRPEETELQIIIPGTQPELTHLPPGVAENIISNIKRQEKEERHHQKEIERNKKPRLN